MAKKCSFYDLQRGYQSADLALERASYSGDKKELKRAMKEHQKYEHALLYRKLLNIKINNAKSTDSNILLNTKVSG